MTIRLTESPDARNARLAHPLLSDERTLEIATQMQSQMWAREARQCLDMLHAATSPAAIADWRRATLRAQLNAATYHMWVEKYLTGAV